MKTSEWRGMGAEAVPGNDKDVGGRAVADTGNGKKRLIWEMTAAYPDQCRTPHKFTVMINQT